VRIERIFRSKFVVVWQEEREALLEKLKCVEAKNPIFRPTPKAPKSSKSAHPRGRNPPRRHLDGAKIFGSVKRRNAGFMAQKCDPMRDRAL
jgi:hypothetical protein